MDELDLINLKKQARVAAATGDKARAVELYETLLAQTPDDASAIMELVPLLDEEAARRDWLQRVLRINPYHEEALAALAELDGNDASAAMPQTATVEVLHCAYHPDRETRLRCNKCGKPICTECAIRTPVGYRCPDCVRELQDKFYTATSTDALVGAAVVFGGGLLVGGAAFLLGLFLGRTFFFGFLAAFFLGPALGGLVSELALRAMGRRRARNFAAIAAGAMLMGMLLAAVITGMIFWPILILAMAGLLMFLALSTSYARLKF